MNPTAKPKRTAEQKAEEEAIRRQHAANPIRSVPAAAIKAESFALILRLIGKLKAVRENQGLSLAEVAARMGVDAKTLEDMESGKALNPTLATVCKWAEAVGQKLEVELTAA